ncbi:hypothetical protein C100_08890 [Sphingobium sp. C100]|nr:hypothetical protein C100_08890 [Sphingobium sp. C100]
MAGHGKTPPEWDRPIEHEVQNQTHDALPAFLLWLVPLAMRRGQRQ